MRKLISILLLLVLLSAPVCLAHGGRLDSNGGHWNHSTGEYHYHEGPHANNPSNAQSKQTIDRSSTNKNQNAIQKTSAWSRFMEQEMTFAKVILFAFVGLFGLPGICVLVSYISSLFDNRKH